MSRTGALLGSSRRGRQCVRGGAADRHALPI